MIIINNEMHIYDINDYTYLLEEYYYSNKMDCIFHYNYTKSPTIVDDVTSTYIIRSVVGLISDAAPGLYITNLIDKLISLEVRLNRKISLELILNGQ